MNEQTSRNHESGYKAVLVREETKKALRDLRFGLSDRDLFQERRLATALLELGIEQATNSTDALNKLLIRAREVVVRDVAPGVSG